MILNSNLDREGSRCIESTEYDYVTCLGTRVGHIKLSVSVERLRLY